MSDLHKTLTAIIGSATLVAGVGVGSCAYVGGQIATLSSNMATGHEGIRSQMRDDHDRLQTSIERVEDRVLVLERRTPVIFGPPLPPAFWTEFLELGVHVTTDRHLDDLPAYFSYGIEMKP